MCSAYKTKGHSPFNLYFAFPYHFNTFTHKIYGQQSYTLEDYFDMMFYLLFYKVNDFSYILYGHTLSH